MLLGLSLVLERRWPSPLRVDRRLGWPIMGAGIALAAWATRTAADTDLENPHRLVLDGPYGRSRHPMYVAWTLAYLGAGPAMSSRWPLILSPALGWWVRREAHREESRLIARFGGIYLRYMERVRRFL